MDDPQLVCYVALRNPKNTIQYGGVVAAPIVKEVLQESLLALNISKRYGGIDLMPRYYIDKRTFVVDNYIGLKRNTIHNYYLNYQLTFIGNGDTIVAQLPSPGERIIEGGNVILYTN